MIWGNLSYEVCMCERERESLNQFKGAPIIAGFGSHSHGDRVFRFRERGG